MLRRGHQLYHVQMDEYGYVLVQTVFLRGADDGEGSPVGATRPQAAYSTSHIGVTPREYATVPLEDIIAAMRRHDDKNRCSWPQVSERRLLGSLEGASNRRTCNPEPQEHGFVRQAHDVPL